MENKQPETYVLHEKLEYFKKFKSENPDVFDYLMNELGYSKQRQQSNSLEEKEVCDTTSTKRLSKSACKDCGTYKDNLGPCETFCQGQNEKCAYCDHKLQCHPIAWHLIERFSTKPARGITILEIMSAIKSSYKDRDGAISDKDTLAIANAIHAAIEEMEA